MSLALLFPLGLLALAAWAVPLLLHLARREQRTPTPFAALRWLAVRARPRQRVRFEEWPLLLARLALIGAFAAVLARPAVVGGGDERVVEVVHPALAPAAARVDAGDAVERRWLAGGFPALDAPRPAPAVATASLLRQLDAELPAGAALVVHVPETLDGLDGERLRLSRPVDWRVHPDTGATATHAPFDPAIPALAIRHDPAQGESARRLRAVAAAWDVAAGRVRTGEPSRGASGVADIAAADAPHPAGDDTVLAFLAAGPLPAATRAWIERGGTALLAHDAGWPLPAPGAAVRDGDGTVLAAAAALGHGRVVQLRRPLTPAAWPAVLEPDFPRQLRALVAPSPPAPTRGAASAHPPVTGGEAFAPAPREYPSALIALLVALFALERWLATGRRRGSAA